MTATATPCFDDALVDALVAGTLAPDVRVRATAHLDSCATCRDLVAEAAIASSADEAPGYRIAGEIARGAMGRILVATDLRLGREVALKQLIDPSPALRARFEREVTITATLQHPGIVPVYQAGTLDSGEPFYAMRRVHGRALDVVIAEATTPAQRLALVPRVLAAIEAIAYAHSAGVIHRDLKPHNILVGEFGEVVVVDWGLAKRVGDASEPAGEGSDANDPMLTSDGAILGTPAYMAPEQAAGRAADVRADVYALGAVLYHALAGVPPRTGKTLSSALEQVRSGHAAPLAEVAPGVPRDLAAIVERALAVDPAARYADAAALASDLRAFLAGRLVAAHAYTRWQLMRRWLARHKAWVAAAVIVVVSVGAIGTVSFSRVRAERDRARAQQAASEELVAFMLDDLRPPLEGLGKLALLHDAGAKVDRYYSALVERMEPGAEPYLRWGSARLLLGDVTYDRGELDAARAHYDAARGHWERASQLAPALPKPREKLAAAYDRLGDVAREQGRKADATQLFEKGLAIRNALAAPDHRGLGISHLKLADLARAEGRLDDALAAYQRSRDAFLRIDAVGHELGVVLGRIGLVESERGKLAESEAAYREELAHAERRLAQKPDDPQRVRAVAMATTHVANTQVDRGEFDEALVTYGTARDLHGKLSASDPDNTVWQGSLAEQWGHIGATQLALDREADAVTSFAKEAEIRAALAARDPSNATWQSELAFAHYHVALGENRMRRLDRAVASLDKAIALQLELVTATPDDATLANELCAYYDLLADTERDRGNVKASLAAVERGLELARRWRKTADDAGWKAREADLLWGRSRTAKLAGNRALVRESLEAAQVLFRQVGKDGLTALQQAVSEEVDRDLRSLAP